MSVPTLSELKAHLGGERSVGSEHDVFLQAALDAALATAAREGGLILDPDTPQVVYRSGGANGTAALWWTAQPVVVSKVELRNFGDISMGWTELDATEWEQLGGRLQRVAGASFGSGGGWPAGHSNIRVTLTAGYDEDNPMPADLRLAILKLAAEEFRQRRGATPTSSREREGGTGAERMARRADALYVIRSYQQVAGF